LLLDEPTRAVDPLQALAIRKLVKEDLVGRQGKTVILATNLLEEAWQLADRVAVISDGMITAIGPPNSLLGPGARLAVYEVVFDRPGPDVDERLRELASFATCEVTAINGTVTARIEVEASAQALTELLRTVSAGGAVREFRPVDPEPAHVFRQIIARARKASP
jgi:ABC-type multidrug transport system ATPase subunit